MALDWISASLFSYMGAKGIKMESLLTLGRQHFSIHRQEIAADPRLVALVGTNLDLLSGDESFAEPFFRAVGFETIESLDASDYESCSLVHNLNQPIPRDWHERSDVVFDGGTLEHVFHFPNAVANAMNLVKLGGVLVTMSPSNNLNGHGFFQFSPELFFRVFCEENGFRVLLMALVESGGQRRMFRVEDPNTIGKRITFGGDGSLQMVMVAMRDHIVQPLTRSPQQSDYSATWKNVNSDVKEPSVNPRLSRFKSSKRWLRGALPASWVYRYDCMRFAMRYKRHGFEGVTQVNSINECFFSRVLLSDHKNNDIS